MNKFLAIAGASAMLLSAATPAFAKFDFHRDYQKPVVSEVKNDANIDTGVYSVANSGLNIQANVAVGHRAEVEKAHNTVYTDVAVSGVKQLTVANTNVNGNCDKCSAGKLNNDARVNTTLVSVANSGLNIQGNVAVGGSVEKSSNYANTGTAQSTVDSWTVVNTNVSLH
jgi:hypothetical protein